MIYVKIMFNLISCILPISLCNVIILHAFNGCHSIVRRNYFFNSRGSLKYSSINFHFKPALTFSCDSSKANYNWSWIYQSFFYSFSPTKNSFSLWSILSAEFSFTLVGVTKKWFPWFLLTKRVSRNLF